MASLSEAFARALCLADDVIIHELYEAQAILQASPDYLALLSHPLLSPSRKAHLLEEGFAEEAHPQTVAILKVLGMQKEEERLHELELEKEAEAVKERLKGIVLEFQIKTGNNGRSFGTVSTKQVAEKLQREHGIQIDRRKIRGHESISTLGDTELNVDLYKNKVIGTIRVHVSAKSAK